MSTRGSGARAGDPEDRDYLVGAFSFLVEELGYSPIGDISVATPEVEVLGWRNGVAGVQVELSGQPLGNTLVGVLRRLVDDEPIPYAAREGWIELDEISLVRRGGHLPGWHAPAGWRGVVDAAADLLRGESDLLTGRGWISRAEVRGAWDEDFERRFGHAPEGSRGTSPLDRMRGIFDFLRELGYVLVFDSETLSPHEYLVMDQLRYQKGDRFISVQRVDWRDDLWTVIRDGERVGGHHETPEAIAAQAARLAEELGE